MANEFVQIDSPPQAQAEVLVNEMGKAVQHIAVYGYKAATSSGLTWGYYGGRWNGFNITSGTLTLTNSATNYIVVARSTGVISVSTSSTNHSDTTNYALVYTVVVAGSVPTTITDERLDAFGVLAATSGGGGSSGVITQNSQSSAYTLVIGDAGKHIFHPSADTTARIWTIPANSSVAFTIGTAVTFVNQNSAGTITISITTDTLRLAGAGTTGSRTLAANGIATALKVTSTEWIISGTNLS